MNILRFRAGCTLCILKILAFSLFYVFIPDALSAQSGILNKRISLQIEQGSLVKVLDEIEARSGCTFIYNIDLLGADRQVTLRYENETLERILLDLFGESVRKAEIRGNRINLQPSKGKGAVKGQVRTSDGQPAEFVNVAIKGVKGTVTDEDGTFRIENVEEGSYTLTVSYLGLQTQERQVTITAGEVSQATFVLTENLQTLKEVIISGGVTNKFAGKETEYVARMPLGNLENAQVYNVVTKELLIEQLNTNINEALVNVPGSVVMNNPAGGLAVSFRGFSGGVNARNGLQTAAVRSSLDPVNLERIEALKGPSGTLFQGLATYGGVINLVTKKPYETRGGSMGYSFGSFGLSRTTIDYNTPLNDERTALFRINAALHREGSFRDAGHNNTYTIAPSFRYQVSDRLDFLVDLELYSFDQTRTGSLDFGPYRVASEIPLQDKALFTDDVNAEGTNVKSFLQANYKLRGNWVSSTNLAIINEQLDNSYQPHYIFSRTGDSIYRHVHLYGPIINKYVNIQQNFTGDFRIGSFRNRLLAGVDYNANTNIRSDRGRGLVIDTMAVARPTKLTSRLIEDAFAASGLGIGSSFSKTARYGGYVSNVLNVTDRLIAMLSLRVDRFENNNANGWKQTAFSPKLGLVYQPVKDQVAVFANLMDGFNNMNTAAREDGTIVNLDPEHATQYEGGVKLNSADGRYNATVSYYYIKVYNAMLTDDRNFFLSQNGEQVSKGLDAEFIANPVPGLNFMAGYAYNDNRYTRAERFEGKYLTGISPHVGNFWVSYKFQRGSVLKNAGLAFGGNFVDDSFRDGENIYLNPAYRIFSSSLFYEMNKWRVGLKMNNLTNTKYYSNGGLLQPSRNFVANVSFHL